MKKLAILLVVLIAPSCTWISDNVCTGSDAVKEVTAEGLSYIPVLGPLSSTITDLLFDAICNIVALPVEMGDSLKSTTGVQTDPTAEGALIGPVTDGTTPEDTGS